MKWTDSQKRLIRKLSGILLLEGVAAPVMPQLSEFTTVNQEQESYYFPIETLRSKNIDLSYFTAPGKGPPGKYQVDVFVNNERIDNRLLLFSADAKGNLVPQLTVKQYEMLGINTTAVPAIRELHSGTVITDISQYAAVTTRLDMNRLRLDIGIPQLLLQNRAKDYIDPALWDTGMPAAFISYDLSGSQSHHNQHNRNSGERRQFLNLRNGINLSGWRLRNYSTWQHGHQGKNEFNSLQNWLEKDMVSLRSRVAAGDTRTSSDVMESFSFRGINLCSQETMLPPSQQGYVPVIRGIAMTPNARVSVRQNDTLIYETYVPVGAFAITDISMAGSGRLDVQITESDGRIQRFSQSFGNLSVMQREGYLKYEIALGEYRQSGQHGTYHPRFTQMTALYGLASDITLYGGGIVADDYYATTLGSGVTLGRLGTVALDASHANSTLNTGDRKNGQAIRIQYNKNFPETDTTFSLASWQYQGEDYYTFMDAANLRRTAHPDKPWEAVLHKQKKSRIQFNIQQKIGPRGSLSLNAWQQDYYDHSHQRSAGASWNFGIAKTSLALSYNLNQYQDRGRIRAIEQIIALTVTLPFSAFASGNSLASWLLTHNRAGNMRQTLGLSGTALAQNNLNYSVQQNYSQGDNEGYGGNLSAGYQGRAGAVNAAWSYDHDSHRISYGARGSLIAHPYGISLSQRLTEGAGYGLIRAPGASGVAMSNSAGIATDWRGYAIAPSLQAYRKNRITLDPASYTSTLDITLNSLQVIPTKEALVLADYQTQIGARALITLIQHDGSVVPFGASTAVVDGHHTGIVGDKGAVYLAGLQLKGTIRATWGSGAGKSCQGHYHLPDTPHRHGISMLTLQCR